MHAKLNTVVRYYDKILEDRLASTYQHAQYQEQRPLYPGWQAPPPQSPKSTSYQREDFPQRRTTGEVNPPGTTEYMSLQHQEIGTGYSQPGQSRRPRKSSNPQRNMAAYLPRGDEYVSPTTREYAPPRENAEYGSPRQSSEYISSNTNQHGPPKPSPEYVSPTGQYAQYVPPQYSPQQGPPRRTSTAEYPPPASVDGDHRRLSYENNAYYGGQKAQGQREETSLIDL
jgi:hepatocyte growth factor-regulated tyrosine kinase substrate